MKKALLLIGVLALALGITYLVLHKSGDSAAKRQEDRDSPLAISSKTSAFNRSFAAVLLNYYRLSDVFASGDTTQIGKISGEMSTSIDSIHFDQLKADTAIVQTVVSLAQSIQSEITGLHGEKTMEQKKREFNMITDELYSLIRAVKYDGSIIYHMRAPGAFADSSEAYWLSPQNKSINPYSGNNANKQTGELIDSIHFAPQVTD